MVELLKTIANIKVIPLGDLFIINYKLLIINIIVKATGNWATLRDGPLRTLHTAVSHGNSMY